MTQDKPRDAALDSRAATSSIGVRIAAFVLSCAVGAGAGHILRHRLVRGLVWYALVIAMVFAMPYTGFAGLVLLLAVHFLAAPLDAALVASGPPRRTLAVVLPIVGLFVAMLVWAVLARVFVVETFKVPAGSMAPTMAIGDLFFVDKRATEPAVGDVIVFRNPRRPEVDFIKRVVGVAGDRLAVRGGVLYRNGAAVPTRALERPCAWDNRDMHEGDWRREQGPCAEQTLGRHRFRIMVSAEPSALEDFPVAPGAAPDIPRDFPGSEGVDGEYTVPAGHVFTMGDNRGNSHDSRFWGPVPLGNVKGTALYVWLSLGPDGVRGERFGYTIP